jgi:tetratricopeptide (TPR) repeat protein
MFIRKLAKLPSWLIVSGILLLTALVYINIIGNKFVWDDLTFIIKWPVTRNIDLAAYFAGELPEKHEGVYRPLRTVFYALSYKLFGLNSHGYKVQAITLHVVGTLAVFLLVQAITKDKWVAYLTALLFGVHPVHTESVDFTAASFDMFAPVFILFSIYFYAKFLDTQRYSNLFITIFFGISGILSGEAALPWPFLIFLYYLFFRKEKGILRIIKNISPFFIITLLYVFMRVFVLKILARGEFDFYKTIVIWIFMFRAVYRYITVLFFPYILSVDYEVGRRNTQIVISKQAPFWLPFIDYKFILGFVMIIISLLFAVRLRRKHKIISFSIFWFYIALTPFLNILPVNAGVAERYLYLSSFGFCLLVSYILLFIYRKFFKEASSLLVPKIISWFYIILILIFSYRTWVRNADWKDAFALWESTVKSTPTSGIAHNNLGREYARKKDYDKALGEFIQVLKISPNRPYIHSNIGKVYFITKDYTEAEKAFFTAIRVDEKDWDAYTYLANIYLNQGKTEEARKVIEKGLAIGRHKNLLNSLAFIYLSLKDYDNAIKTYEEAIKSFPKDPLAYNNLAVVYLGQNNLDEGIKLLEQSVRIYPDDPEAYYNLGEAYKKMGIELLSKKYYQEAVKRAPEFEEAKVALETYFN